MRWLLLLLPFFLIAKTPEEIQVELDEAEAHYKKALEMFNPWYTGPLLTPSATMMPVGMGNTQPYLFMTDTYGAYNQQREATDFPSSRFSLREAANVLTGLTSSADFNVSFSAVENWQGGRSSSGYSDMSLTLGLLINKQTLYAPQAKFTVTETFPTGRYNNLTPSSAAVQATGAGAFTTQFGLAFSKLFFWATKHPTNLRLFLSYALSSKVHVEGFNAYGGGYSALGVVRPGNTFTADFGTEVSLDQHWVAALDVVYTASDPTNFSGSAGTLASGAPSTMASPYSDSLSLAPAFEYNWNSNIGLIAGVWFTVYGRSSSEFISGIISVSYTFP